MSKLEARWLMELAEGWTEIQRTESGPTDVSLMSKCPLMFREQRSKLLLIQPNTQGGGGGRTPPT